MAEEAGEENFFLFGLTAHEVASSEPWYSPYWHYENEPETRKALRRNIPARLSRVKLEPAAPGGRLTAQTLRRFDGSPYVVDATLQDIDDQCA